MAVEVERRDASPAGHLVRRGLTQYLVCCSIATIGMFLDGWSHTLPDNIDSFFTPSHGVVYAGVAAAVLTLRIDGLRHPEVAAVHRADRLLLVGVALLGTAASPTWSGTRCSGSRRALRRSSARRTWCCSSARS